MELSSYLLPHYKIKYSIYFKHYLLRQEHEPFNLLVWLTLIKWSCNLICWYLWRVEQVITYWKGNYKFALLEALQLDLYSFVILSKGACVSIRLFYIDPDPSYLPMSMSELHLVSFSWVSMQNFFFFYFKMMSFI